MKVFFSVLLFVGYVTARGSGPYLPSGWKPDGPAFYLPSEVQKPAANPIKDVIFEETEPAGSDSLREYGPPKVQEVSQYISNQGLPDTVTDQTFSVERGIETAAVVLEASAVEGNNEKNTQIISEEVSAVTEVENTQEKTGQVTTIIEDEAEIDGQTLSLATQPLQDSIFESTERNVEATVASIEAVVAEEEQSVTTEREIVKLQEVDSVTEVSEIKEDITTQVLDVSEEAQEIKVLSNSESQHVNTEAQVAQEVQQIIDEEVKKLISEELKAVEEVKSDVSEEIKTVEEIKSTVSEEIKAVEQVKETVTEQIKSVEEIQAIVSEEVKAVEGIKEAVAEVVKEVEKAVISEEVKAVDNGVAKEVQSVVVGVNNIAQALANVESEIKAEQAEKTTTLELTGSLADAPEGFLEYGPPGFREYGPPNEDELLRTNTLEQESNVNNEARRRRFSPKFRPTITPVLKRNH